MRRAKKATIVAASVALAAGVVSVIGIANAATTAVAGIQIVMENSGKCLNVSGASTANGAKVVQYTCVASASNDKWKVVPKGNDSDGFGLYWIQAAGSGKCLTVQGASTKNNAALIQYSCTTGGNELWYIEEQDGLPTNRLISAGSGLCLDVPGRSTANNVNLVQYTCQAGDGTSNERFTLPPAASAAVVHRPYTGISPVAVIQGGAPAGGGTAPVYYNWITSTHQWFYTTDLNPDPFPPAASAKAQKSDGKAADLKADAANTFGYTGRPVAALLNDKRVEVIAHEATAGDVQTTDETKVGTGVFPDFVDDIGGDMNAQPTVGAYATGRLAIYAIINGALWYNPEAAGNPEAPIGGWRSLGGSNLTGVPTSVPNGAGARIFAATTAGQIQTATLSGTTLSDWTSLGGTGLGDPDVVAETASQSFVTARTTSDGSIVYKEQKADGSWPADWTTIAGVTAAGNPSAVVGSADGTLDIAIRGTDNLIYVAQETAAASGQFGGWVQISDPTNEPGTVATSDPTAFGYTVPSGQSFGVVFQNATSDTDGPFGIYFRAGTVFNPPAASVSRAAKARTGLVYQAVGKSSATKVTTKK